MVDVSRIAPTEQDEWRNRLLRGEVHDENAAAMGGVAGHAGLFGTAESVLAVSGAWLRGYHGRESILDGRTCQAVYDPPRICRSIELGVGMGYSVGAVLIGVPVFPSGRSGISATLARRYGLIRCANWKWCCYPIGYIRAGGTRRLRLSARGFTIWSIGSLCLRKSCGLTRGPGNRPRFLFRRDTSCL